jgi:hypothetical protein
LIKQRWKGYPAGGPAERDARDGMALAGKQSRRFKSKLRLLIPA